MGAGFAGLFVATQFPVKQAGLASQSNVSGAKQRLLEVNYLSQCETPI